MPKAQPARQISKGKLLQLVKESDNCNSRMASERAALGAKFEAAATADNFSAKAFRTLRPLLKMEPGPQAHLWRTIQLYAAHLDIGTQGDIEDVINADVAKDSGEEDDYDDAFERAQDARNLGDEQEDGEADADPVDSVLSGMDVPEVGRFRSAIAEAGTIEAVNLGLERFTENYPELGEEALAVAQARLGEINAELGGGEDLRAKSVQDGERTAQEQRSEAAAATADTKGKAKRSPRKPPSPAVDAARDRGVGDDFGNAKGTTAVH